MAAVPMEVDSAPGTDEAWLVWRARQCLKTDPYATKAWLITAKTLFPRNFNIQYEAYSIEVANKNTTAAAKLVEEMFVNFPQEQKLWDEIKGLLAALQSDIVDAATQTKKEIFSAIPQNLQCHMLSQIAESTTDILERCRLMTLVLQRYPDRVPEQGVKLIDSLLSTEKHAHAQNAVNCYRKCMVVDVLPVVLSAPPAELPQKQALRWLQKGIEFYISYITCPPSQDSLPSPPGGADLLSPTTKKTLGCSGYKRVQIPGLPERESYILQPWDKLFKLFQQIAIVLDWKVDQIFTAASRETQWQQIYAMFQTRSQPHGDSMVPHKQILYCTTLLFLDCLYAYSCRIDSEQFAGTAVGSLGQKQIVMIEAFPSSNQEPRLKKSRVDSTIPRIDTSKSVTTSKEISQNFLTALKCWDLLHSAEPLEKDFNKMCQHWKADTWFWLKGFEVDVNIYQGEYVESVKLIKSQASMPRPPTSQIRIDVQLSCCYYFLAKFAAAAECILNVVNSLPLSTEPTGTRHLAPSGDPGRHLQLMQCSASELMPYCVQLLLNCLRETAFRQRSDLTLGHLIILLQYDWPHYEALFHDVMKQIRQNGSFTYSLFFNYVTNVDILEEFAFIESPDGGGVTLDVLSTSTKVIAQQRTVTRGVNRNVKEDFRVSLEKQVARSNENVENVIREFLQHERDAIQMSLA